MTTKANTLYSIETIEAIIDNPQKHWKKQFKEMIISMIASNTNELLWYANFLSRCEYEFHFDPSFSSAIYFNGKSFVIVINPVILGHVHKDQIIAILKHSAGHIIHQHFVRNTHEKRVDKEVIETAKDIVINGCRDLPYIKDLPATGAHKDSPLQASFYQTLKEKYGIEAYEVGREFEYYIDLITSSQKESLEEDQSCTQNLDDDSNEALSMEAEASDDAGENLPSPQVSNRNDEEGGNHSTSESPEESQERDNIPQNSDDTDENETQSTPTDNGEETDVNEEEDITSDISQTQQDTLSQRTLEALSQGECQIDNHSYAEQRQDEVGLEEDVLNAFMDTSLKEMINDATNFSRGYTPGIASEALNQIEKRKSHKDWKKIFNKKMRNFLSNSLRYREPNKSRQHPIFQDDLDLYGYSPGKKPNLAVVLDVRYMSTCLL